MTRLTFLSHFILCLAVAAGAWFAWRAGAVATVWASDARIMSGVILAWFVGSALWLGRLAWLADTEHVNARFGYVATEMAVVLGVLGMALGLSWQGQAIATQGTAIFSAWAVQLYSTILGVGTCAILLLMTFNLNSGVHRGHRA